MITDNRLLWDYYTYSRSRRTREANITILPSRTLRNDKIRLWLRVDIIFIRLTKLLLINIASLLNYCIIKWMLMKLTGVPGGPPGPLSPFLPGAPLQKREMTFVTPVLVSIQWRKAAAWESPITEQFILTPWRNPTHLIALRTGETHYTWLTARAWRARRTRAARFTLTTLG